MIGSVRGILLSVSEGENPEANIEVDGIGYRTTIGKSALPLLGEEGSEVFVYVSHQVREDSEVLYGFLELGDRNGFETLLKVHNVGPALAMEILDCYNLDQLQEIVLKQDLDALTSIKRVGKATAERLLTELKNKLDIPDIAIDTEKVPPSVSDVRKALVELGYSTAEIRSALENLKSIGEDDPEELLKQALLYLTPPK